VTTINRNTYFFKIYNQLIMKSLLQKGIPMMLALIILTLNACKDPCKDVACLNGGACVDGTCVCANGYTGANCDTAPDLCVGVPCLNGGTCVNGTCVCANGYSGVNCEIAPDPCAGVTCVNGNCANGICNCSFGWTGSDCSIADTPIRMTISRIDVYDFPVARQNGTAWDSGGSGPDIYVFIDESPVDFMNYELTTTIMSDVNINSSNPLVYNLSSPITINNIDSRNFGVGLIDDDGIFGAEYMIYFTSVDFTVSYYHLQPIVRIWNSDDSIDIRLYVEWQF